jgi:hypothetical protein
MTLVKTLKDLLVADRTKIEKLDLKCIYIISKSIPKMGDQHLKMEITQKLILC